MATTKYKQTIKGSKDAAKPWERQAELLQKQIEARFSARKGLNRQLANAKIRNRDTRRSVVKDLLSGDLTAREGYDRTEKEAEGNLGITAASSRLNRAREGASALAEVSGLGGGLTDKIKALAASVRNMKANFDPGVSDYASAVTSINNSLGDLNTNTTTNINNALREQNASDAQASAEWSAGYQQIYADTTDLYGQKGAALEQMADALADKKSKSKQSGTKNIKSTQEDEIDHNDRSRAAVAQAKGAFGGSAWSANQLAAQQGHIFTTKIPTIDQMNAETTDPSRQYTAAAMKENQSNLDELANAGTLRKLEDAQGSTLRKKKRDEVEV